jgi:hypothetical protein
MSENKEEVKLQAQRDTGTHTATAHMPRDTCKHTHQAHVLTHMEDTQHDM